jgi:hypothetical protein
MTARLWRRRRLVWAAAATLGYLYGLGVRER